MGGSPEIAPAGLLRVLTCGSVDDGKSTLLGRLLLDADAVPDDLLLALGPDEGAREIAHLLDGLEAEREQGITIDVTYRAFSSGRRRFRLLDAPGHEQYTRNMATAASGADVAILLVDARKGLLRQTARHAAICALFGVRHVVLAVNKMDAVGWSAERFRAIAAAFEAAPAGRGFASLQPIPLSALRGDNVVRASDTMPWWEGPTLLAYLEGLDPAPGREAAPLRLPVQLVELRDGVRHYLGTVASGTVRAGEPVLLCPSGRRAHVASVTSSSGPAAEAVAGEAVAVTLGEEADLARGDVVAAPDAPPKASTAFAADVLWFDATDLFPGRSYLLRLGTATVPATVTSLRHRTDPETGNRDSARTLAENEIGSCHLATASPIAFEPFRTDPGLGSFILMDRADFRTVGAGVVAHELRRATNVHEQALRVGRARRSDLKGHRPAVVWFTGLSGAGKSTLANALDERLVALGCHTAMLDGDNLRHGLCRDLGFTEADRVENIRRAAEVARIALDAGLIALCAFISPYRAERAMAREIVGADDFLEVFVDAPVELCMERDPKGLYARAVAGEIPNFTGVSAPYEPPEASDLRLRTADGTPEDLASAVLDALREREILP